MSVYLPEADAMPTKINLDETFFQAVVVFAVTIASLSAGNILLKLGMDHYGALTSSRIPGLQAMVKEPQLPLCVLLMTMQFIRTLTLFTCGCDASVVGQ